MFLPRRFFEVETPLEHLIKLLFAPRCNEDIHWGSVESVCIVRRLAFKVPKLQSFKFMPGVTQITLDPYPRCTISRSSPCRSWLEITPYLMQRDS